MNRTRHDHRGSLWAIAGGALLWCYQCGAWRPNNSLGRGWHRPTGIGGENPAMTKYTSTGHCVACSITRAKVHAEEMKRLRGQARGG